MRNGLSHKEAGLLGVEKTKEIAAKKLAERIEKYNLAPKKCKNCQISISYYKRFNDFCGHSCAAVVNNKNVTRHGIPTTIKKCLNCESDTRKSFCDKSCYISYKKKNFLKLVEESESGGKKATHSTYRKFLIEKFGAKCMRIECGWSKVNPYTGKVPIELNHIDGDSTNTKISNLELLCPSCHSLTSTYKGLNVGRGRYKRMKRYKEGKSF